LEVSVLDSERIPVTSLDVSPEQVQVMVPIAPLPNFKEVAVIVNYEGTAPAFGYYVSSIEVTPATVTVQGPPDVINEMPGFVRAGLVDLTGVRDDFTRTVGLELPEGVLAVDVSEIRVSVEVDAFQGSIGVRRPLEVVGLEEGMEAELSPESVDMILSGPLAVLEQLAQDDVRVILDLSEFPVGTYQIEPEVVTLPEGVSSESLLPVTIEVRIQRASTTS
jgi:YbbR domain-containing protein